MHAAATLQDLLRDQLASGLPALAGARIAGTVPVHVDLLNQVIADVLGGVAQPTTGAPGAGGIPVDVPALARLVRRLRVDAAPGVVTLDFEIGVDG
jgi:hypothetical protein